MRIHYLKGLKLQDLVFFSLVFSLYLFTPTFAQDSVQSSGQQAENELLIQKWNEAAGSFQIQIVNSRRQPSVSASIIEEIERRRHQTEVVYIPYLEDVRIMILPRNVISGEYQHLELFKYVSE